jgi:uncharacterized cupredoxin-like copper-binding protein
MRRMGLMAVLAAGVLVLAGCGGGGSARTVKVTMGPGMTFNPAQLSAAPGETLLVEVINADAEQHDFAVPFLGEKLLLKPGYSGSVKLKPTKAGTFEIVCTLPGHREAGMVGALVVK